MQPKDKNLLGLNINKEEVHIRLRFDESYIEYEAILGTVLHELAHMKYSRHSKKFYKLVETLENEYVKNIISRTMSHEEEVCIDLNQRRILMAEAAEFRRAMNESSRCF